MDIVLIDDDPNVRETFEEFLCDLGHRVRAASTGEAALWMLEEATADLVLTDLKMPGLTGIEVLSRVRERWPAIEVVLITGFGTLDDAVSALRLGAYDFLVKPVRFAQLERLITHVEERVRFARDNRELREVVERLRDLDERRQKFVALASHEMRTPTTVAAGLVALLVQRREELPEDLRPLSDRADQALHHLKEVVEDLGDLGLGQGGGLPLNLSVRRLGELEVCLADQIDMYRPLRDLSLLLRLDSAPEEAFRADLRKLCRAAGALLQNAVKFTPDGGSVEVSVSLDGEVLTLEVADTGIGVPDVERDKIFDSFYGVADIRHHRTSGHAFGGGGLGIGLPLARVIAEAHGGEVVFAPRAGGGSRFALRIPVGGDR